MSQEDRSISISGTIKKKLYNRIKGTQGDLTLSKRMSILFEKGFRLEEMEKNDESI